MKPGDLIEWYYKYNNQIVAKNECIWSSIMKKYVPVGEISLLCHIDKDTYSWLNSKGLFHACVDDMDHGPRSKWSRPVVPRAREKYC